jgi:hypothetical protein
MDVDPKLIFDVERRVNAANVHQVKTWLFCYQLSKPNTPRRKFYENLLRHFAYDGAKPSQEGTLSGSN